MVSARLSQSKMYAEGTKRNHRSNLKQFMLFCTKFKKPFCPTNSDTLMAFARLESTNISYESLKNIFSSIKFIHLATGKVFPEDNWQVESTLKAIKRELAGAPNQTLPISPKILLKMYMFCDISTPKGLAYWSMVMYPDQLLLYAEEELRRPNIHVHLQPTDRLVQAQDQLSPREGDLHGLTEPL